ncbi:MAG: hypothetical protein WC389_22505 [Lutibacter sp.]
MKAIKAFAEKKENGIYNAYIIFHDKTRQEVDESIISAIWWDWIKYPNTRKTKDENGYTLFVYRELRNYEEIVEEGKIIDSLL